MIIKIKYFDLFALTPRLFRGLLLLMINFLFIFQIVPKEPSLLPFFLAFEPSERALELIF